MRLSSDTKPPRSVKAEFDPDFRATPHGGSVLIEKALRSLGIRRAVADCLPQRSDGAVYSMQDGVHAIVAGMLLGGHGMESTQALRHDPDTAEIFGFRNGVPSQATVERILGDMAGLKPRVLAEHYQPAGPAHAALDMFGEEKKPARLRRVLPETPDAATPECLEKQNDFLLRTGKRCLATLPFNVLLVNGYIVIFADATDLGVTGTCFEGAARGRDGERGLRWLTTMLGPIAVSAQLCEGNLDEGRTMPALFGATKEAVASLGGNFKGVLVLMDAAYYEKQVIEALPSDWKFIVCANQQRNALTRLAQDQPEYIWSESGADVRRGWSASQTACFVHQPDGWQGPVNIIARRWQKADEINGAWHYSFLATRFEKSDLPKKLLSRHGYSQTIWMLYGTKQGRENHYKTPLRDFRLHNPPSGRFGINQAYYTLGLVASNIAMVIRYRVLQQEDRGMAFWRVRKIYFSIAGYLKRGARCLKVFLSGFNVNARRQVLWHKAFAAAGQL